MNNNRGPWITTFTGHKFHFLDPQPDDIDIIDIAVALSREGRFAGHCQEFYCVTPDTLILTHDFRWVPAGSIKTGDSLWGFDEHSNGHRNIRRWRKSSAIVYGMVEREIYKIKLTDGTEIKCSAEHPLLSSTKAAGNQTWLTAKEVYERDHCGQVTYLPRFIKPWKEPTDTYNAGWLGGIIDGEGTMASIASRGNNLSIAQKEGFVSTKIEAVLYELGFNYSKNYNKTSDVYNFNILGGIPEQVRLVGQTRPVRLIPKMQSRLEGREFKREGDLVQVAGVTYLGKGEVVALETSSHTYITEGYGSHNSVAQHCVAVSEKLEDHTWPNAYGLDFHIVKERVALLGLLHDASEAYLKDILSPLKDLLPEYKKIEVKVCEAIYRKWDVYETLKTIYVEDALHTVDKNMFMTEVRDLVKHKNVTTFGVAYPDVSIKPVPPDTACVMYLARFHELIKRIE